MKHTNGFIDYLMSFYGKDGLYPIKGITRKKIMIAVCELALKPNFSHKFGGGDSYDREVVRGYILDNLVSKKSAENFDKQWRKI